MILSFRKEDHLKPSGFKSDHRKFRSIKDISNQRVGMLNKYIGTSKLNEIPCIRSYQSSLQRLQNRTKIERVSYRALSCLLSILIVYNNQIFNSIQKNVQYVVGQNVSNKCDILTVKQWRMLFQIKLAIRPNTMLICHTHIF